MINKDTITIKLDKNTIKKLNILKQVKSIDNMTTYCKKILTETIKVNEQLKNGEYNPQFLTSIIPKEKIRQ